MKITKCKCVQCNHEWFPRKEQIGRCPHCKTVYWNDPEGAMNQLEKKALGWLSDRFNISRLDIQFRFKDSPDFIMPDGTGFEVKRLFHGRIAFYGGQWGKLVDYGNCYILTFNDDPQPCHVISMSQLPVGIKKWQDVNISWYHFDYLQQLAERR